MEKRTFPFESRYGNRYLVAFQKTRYVNGDGLAITVWCAPFDSVISERTEWEPYGVLTVNLGVDIPKDTAFLDSNNLPDLVDFVIERGWAARIGSAASGYCVYPLVRLTEEFIKEICVEEGGGMNHEPIGKHDQGPLEGVR